MMLTGDVSYLPCARAAERIVIAAAYQPTPA
eukprot:COSAG06_NODE_25964_length_625_cov_0.682510_2_plen_30_part_01